jgi:general secretion pathway protein D
MRMLSAIAVALCLSFILAHAETPAYTDPDPAAASQSDAPPVPGCAGKSAKGCRKSRDDFRKAREAFNHGIKLRDARPEEALVALNLAVQLQPGNVKYVCARALLIQQLAYQHIERGNHLLSSGDPTAAANEFRKALEFDPRDQFASQRLLDATYTPPPVSARQAQDAAAAQPSYTEPEWYERETIIHPKPNTQDLHLRGTTGSAYAQIGAAFNIKISLDSSTPERGVRLDLNQVTFERAMNTVALVTHSFWTPVASGKVLVAADNPNKRKQLERWLLRTFYLPEVPTPQGLNDIANLLRNLFEFRSVTQSPGNGTITVRGPASKVLAATQFLKTLRFGRPQVMLDLEVYEVSGQLLRDIGIVLPSQFTIFSLSGVGQQSLQTTGVLPALVSQGEQQNTLTTPFQSGVLTFGGGKSLMGFQIPPVTANFSENRSRAISLSSVTLRGSQGTATTFRLGTRYPVVTASYAVGPANGAAAPTITYEDLGITVKATPLIHQEDVTLDVAMELSSLGSALFNGIPAINQRSYTGTITARKDEPVILASSVSQSEITSLQGIPGLANLALLGRLTSDRNTEDDQEELLVMITPHVIDNPQDVAQTEVYLPLEK